MKNFLVRFTAVLLGLQGFVAAQLLTLPAARAASSAPAVVINEVMWMGSRDSGGNHAADEWIELYNNSDTAVDLTDWLLTNTGLSADTLDGQTLNPGQYLLISNYPPGHVNSVLAPGILSVVDPSINLPGEDSCPIGGIELRDADGRVVDRVTCFGGSWPAGLTNANERRAMERSFPYSEELWHTSVGFVNMKSAAKGYTFATPLLINDRTQAVAGFVNDGSGSDIDWTDNVTNIDVNWGGFGDDQSGIAYYEVGLGTTPTTDDFMSFVNVGLATSHTFHYPAITTSGSYFTIVRVTNGAGISSIASSDGFTIDIVNPEPPTNVVATDTPADNGGSVTLSWDASVSVDEISYQLNYRKQGTLGWTSVLVGPHLTHQISGLENAPTTYEFTVEAIDFSNRHSLPSAVAVGQALDNLAPVLALDKIIVGQNKPTIADTVFGIAGAVSEISTVNVFDRDPSLLSAVLLGSVLTNPDGSFASISIGDNQHATVYLQVVDLAGNPASVVALQNDIVAPNAPTLTSAIATCQSETCRVELSWLDNGPDTATFQVGYTIDGVETLTLPTSSTALVLDLPTGKGVSFVVYAFDQYGNRSAGSNVISIQLTAGVKTTVDFKSGSQITTTEAIPGSREVIEATLANTDLSIIPPAQASGGDEASQPTPVKDVKDQDWSRIFIAVLLLLIVAGGLYLLSRTFRDVPADEPIIPVADGEKESSPKPKAKPTTKSGNKRKRR
jgi:hypothetical protein